LFVSVGEGAISLTNNAGLLVVTAGGAAFVANINTAPVPTTEQPQTPPASIQPLTSLTAIIQPTLPSMASGSGYVMSYAYLGQKAAAQINGIMGLTGVTATFNSTSQLTSYSTANDSSSLGAASVTFSATDGIIGWGRWDGNNIASGTNNPMTPGMTPGVFHYVIGLPTAAMPTSGVATYNLMGYTNPTATDSSTGWKVSGSLSANFATTNVGISMVVANASQTYSVNGSASRTAANFTGSFIPTDPGCFSCTASVNGFFAGTNASRAGLTYQINNSSGPGVQGAAAFASTTPPPPLP